MNKSTRPETQAFYQALKAYSLIVKKNKATLEENPWLKKQVTFWIESVCFLITELEVWDQMGDRRKCEATILKAQKALNHISELPKQLT